MSCLDKCAFLIPYTQIEAGAQTQLCNYLKEPFCLRAAVMPDIHTGYALPVGAVVLLEGVISPAAVGVDIGCGMCCIRTDVPIKHIKGKEEKLFKQIYSTIPVGFGSHAKKRDYPDFKSAILDKKLDAAINLKLKEQLGTLGGGNHFIEIGETREGNIGITIHSGSRNAGKQICDHYCALAKKIHTELKGDFLFFDRDEGKAYFQDMNFMLSYALENRLNMMVDILDILGLDQNLLKEIINENHNHAEDLDGKILHRKGATPAAKDQLGVIPGNMRDGVYITKGLGNDKYLSSASHGAGRKGSRTWAKQKDTVETFAKLMNGIVAKVDKHTLDEAPWAYKKIEDVIKAQEGIVVDIIDHIRPIINIKG
jgi:tRNA-splicing ligase RtcB